MPLFSIVTTCFNAADCIQATIESVLNQDFRDFEYIIMDGISNDDTLQIAGSFMDAFQDAQIPYHIFSEKDHGIYEGMNHAVVHSTGRYINFMNAGDHFYEKDTLSKVAKHILIANDSKIPDIVFGDAVSLEFGNAYRYGKDLNLIEQKMPFSHQSVFAQRQLLTMHPFNENFRIGADYDFLLTCYRNKAVFSDSGVTVCTVTLDGVSSVDLLNTFIETVAIKRAHGIDPYPGKAYAKALNKYKLKQFVMDHFPKPVIKTIRKLQRIARGQNEHC